MTLAPPRIKDRSVIFPVHSEDLSMLRDMLADALGAMVLPVEQVAAPLHITIASGIAPAHAAGILAALRMDAGNRPFIGARLVVPSLALHAHLSAGPAAGRAQPDSAPAGGWSPLLMAAFAG